MSDVKDIIPEAHMKRPGGLGMLINPVSLRPRAFIKNASISIVGGVVASTIVATVTALVGALAPNIGSLPPSVIIALGMVVTMVAWMVNTADTVIMVDERDMEIMRSIAYQVLEMRTYGDPTGEDRSVEAIRREWTCVQGKMIIASEKKRHEELSRTTTIRLFLISRSLKKSELRIGDQPGAEIRKIALDAVQTLLVDAIREWDAIEEADRASAERIAPSAIEDLREELHRIVSNVPTDRATATTRIGTGRAHVDRLIARAEEALAIDPDLVDAGGARIDHAIRRHLPALLAAHAESARHALVTDLSATDRMLDEGVETIRSSVEEALSTLRHRKADGLRAEVGFLKARRGGLDDRSVSAV